MIISNTTAGKECPLIENIDFVTLHISSDMFSILQIL
jgi:hypothetical protein